MYTKFSERLSIKYPHHTEYPMPTGRSLDVERPEQKNCGFQSSDYNDGGDERCCLSAQPAILGTNRARLNLAQATLCR